MTRATVETASLPCPLPVFVALLHVLAPHAWKAGDERLRVAGIPGLASACQRPHPGSRVRAPGAGGNQAVAATFA
jgi:hypothetical protein